MHNYINVEFFHAFNPLYAVPIVAVILCAFIVYAFGFKSPVQPPSFDGIEEEKKYAKKRKSKDNNKGKLLQNGKLNGSSSNKNQVASTGKKKETEKYASPDKPVNEKPSVNEKKAAKKARQQNEKKSAQERKKDSISHDDTNDDGWVQLVSKKGRKNRKKEDVNASENQSVVVKTTKSVEMTKSDESSQVEESPTKTSEYITDSPPLDRKQQVSQVGKEDVPKDVATASNYEKAKDQVVVEVSKPDASSQKLPTKENLTKDGKLFEEGSNKSKKKKKKSSEVVHSETDSATTVSEPPAVQVVSELPASQEKSTTNIVIASDYPQVVSGKAENDASELRSSNVAFDELAGLYPPDAKEQRRKKKVRRDH